MARSLQYLTLGLLAAGLVWAFPSSAQQGAKDGEWRSYAAETASTGYSPLDQINRDNFKNLQVAWTWKFDNIAGTGNNETTPLMVKGVLYFTAGDKRVVIAANAGTGETIWMYRPDEGARADRAPRKITRGVAYWTDGKQTRILLGIADGRLISLDAKTGLPDPGFGRVGTVDLREGCESEPPHRPKRSERMGLHPRRDRLADGGTGILLEEMPPGNKMRSLGVR